MKSQNILFICQANKKIGLGHLTRIISLIKKLDSENSISIKLLLFGDSLLEPRLKNIDSQIYNDTCQFKNNIIEEIEYTKTSLIVFDLCPRELPQDVEELLADVFKLNIKMVSIDSLYDKSNFFEFIWAPSFYNKFKNDLILNKKVISGWGSFLIQKRLKNPIWKSGKKILVLTGAADTEKLYDILPKKLDSGLDSKMEINWVQGPFSNKPTIPSNSIHNWVIHKNPESLDSLITETNYALTVFGVSFFETIQYGIPTVVFSPYGNKDNEELNSLKSEGVASVALSIKAAISNLNEIIINESYAINISKKALGKMKTNGVKKLSEKVLSLLIKQHNT